MKAAHFLPFLGPSIALVGGAVTTWLWRHRDRKSGGRETVQAFVRDCEGRRVLWWPYAWEQADLCYRSVQELRKRLRETVGALPSTTDLAPFDSIRDAAETFCARYEHLDADSRNPSGWGTHRPLEELLEDLRETVVPELEILRIRFRIPRGEVADTWDGFGAAQRVIEFKPPDQGE